MKIPDNFLAGWKVVVVDDEPDSLEIASMLLEMYGATVLPANNGRDALKLITSHSPRFVISDLSMPEMTGWELLEALKLGDRRVSGIPVVALTAHASAADRNRALALGFHNYLTKPLQPETFIEQLLALLVDEIPELTPILNS